MLWLRTPNKSRHSTTLPGGALRQRWRGHLFALFLTLMFCAMSALAAEDSVLVDLVGLDAPAVEELKQVPGVSWWVEAGNVLLLAGDIDTIRDSVPAQRWLAEPGPVRADELALHARGCNDRGAAPDARLLVLPGETHDLVRRPRSFAPAPQRSIDPALGAPEFEPVAANSVIARMHRLDRPRGALPAEPGIVPVVAAVDAARWLAALDKLTAFDRSSYSPQLPAARQWLAQRFDELGLKVSEPEFAFPWATPAPLANVLGFWTGTHEPRQWVVVGAHYDSRNSVNNASGALDTPGADDNASGCAGVLEAARAVLPFRPRRSVMFICYAGEEQGLHGSIGHVQALTASGELSRVVAMLNMDMIGWSPDHILGVRLGVRIDVGDGAANLALAQQVADAALSYVPALSPDHLVISTSTCCSDHMPYLNAGLPAVHSIHRGTTSYPHYHRSTDTTANLGPHAEAIGGAIVRMNVAALAQLSGASDLIFANSFPKP